MKSKLMAVTLLLSLAGSLQGATREEIMKCGMWMMSYHANSSPEEVLPMFSEIDRLGLFADPSKQYPFLGFASRLFQEHPEKLESWFAGIDGFEETSKEILYWSLWLSGSDEGSALLKRKGYSHPKDNYYGFDGSSKAMAVEEMDVLRDGYLDMNWGQYMASGDKEPVIRILQCLAWYELAKDSESREVRLKRELARLASWSAKSHCQTIPGFKEVLGEIYVKKLLGEPALSYLGLLLTDVYPERFYTIENSEGPAQIWMKPLESNKALKFNKPIECNEAAEPTL